MNDLNTSELKVVREALEYALVSCDRALTTSAIKKVDAMLEREGLRFQRKAFQNEWKKLNKDKVN